MAIFHAHGSFVSRSTGRSVVQCAAYIAKTELTETRRNLIADYQKKNEVGFLITLAPTHAPDWMKTLAVWDHIETFEDSYAVQRYRQEINQEKYINSAQTGQTLEVALPRELNLEVCQELLVDFATDRFVSRDLVVTIAVHNNSGNPHAHLLISRRSVTSDGTWSWKKDRLIVTKSALLETRKLWAEKTNFYLAREGIDVKIDHRSYVEQGINLTPTHHEGWYAHKIESSRIAIDNQKIRAQNKELVALEPKAILTELMQKQSTFAVTDLSKLVQYRVGDDFKLGAQICATSLAQSQQVGVDLYDEQRFTTKEQLDLESQSITLVEQMLKTTSQLVTNTETFANNFIHLNAEQQQAVIKLCEPQQLTVLVGYAGTGKTTTLRCVVAAHKEAGMQVIGMALSANAAAHLGQEINSLSETTAFYLDKWERLNQAEQKFWEFHASSRHGVIVNELANLQQYTLTKNHLVVVDEAAMIGSQDWHIILQQINKSQAKLIVVGDNQQFKAIAAGDFSRKMTELAVKQERCAQLTQIVRQKEDWMRDASHNLAKLNVHSALAAYENHGCIKELHDLATIAENYCLRRQNENQTGLLLAYTRSQCSELNLEVRKILKQSGVIAQTDIMVNNQPFSIGDEIVFLANDRRGAIKTDVDFMVKNGTCGKILAINNITIEPNAVAAVLFNAQPKTEQHLTVAIGKITATFTSAEYNQFTHGYALTLHKAQGKTVDWSMVVASKHMDAHATYVALTRHRNDVTLFYERKTFSSFKNLQQSLSRVANKDLVVDYSIPETKQPYWEQMQEYLLLGRDLAVNAENKSWAEFNNLKQTRQELAKHIVNNWNNYQDFARQAGIGLESLAIAANLKARPLSLAESYAKERVNTYVNTSLQTRALWQEIRGDCSGANCYHHEKYAAFTKLRQERNQLATEIIKNYPLHKEWTQNQTFFVSLKMLTAQSKQGIDFSAQQAKWQRTTFTEEQIINNLREVGMSWLYSHNQQVITHHIQQLYNAAITYQPTTPELTKKIMIAGSVLELIQNTLFYKEDLRSVRSQVLNIALIAADLKLSGQHYPSESILIIEAKKVFIAQQQKFSTQMVQLNISVETQNILVDVQCRNFNYTGKELSIEQLQDTVKTVTAIQQELTKDVHKPGTSKYIDPPGFYAEVIQTMKQNNSIDIAKTIKDTNKRLQMQETQIVKTQETQLLLQQQKIKELEQERSL